MKKHILLAIGLAALYLAAREYGIRSIDDVKRILKPYLGALDIDEFAALLNSAETENPGVGSPDVLNISNHESLPPQEG